MSGYYLSSLRLLLMIVSYSVLARGSRDDCIESPPCEEIGNENWSGFMIGFPFRLAGFQQDHCGLPGVNLSCTNSNETVLDLPNSQSKTKLHVKEISYPDNYVRVYVPEFHRSSKARRDLKLLNLSTTPFRFSYGFSSISLMNCSEQLVQSTGDDTNLMLCFRDDGGQNSMIRAVISSSHVEDKSEFINCTKMYSYTAPVNPYAGLLVNYFALNWLMPGCEACERQNKICRWNKNSTETEIGCFNRDEQTGDPFIIPPTARVATGSPIKSIVTAVSTVGSFLVLAVAVATFYLITLDRKDRESQIRIEKFLEDYIAFKPSRYNYSDIKKITDHFKVKLGQGAYGTVFKGKLSSDILVAVKILNNNTITEKGEEFINEVATMGRIHHINVVRLVGYCADGFRRALVYDFLPNYSLEKYISPATSSTTNQSLSWLQLQGIALGVAKGIDYLHQGCDQRILHFDIKPHNILLDHNFTPKICDFGLAKLCSKDQSIVSMTMTRGTIGYIAPEVFSRNFGNVSYKSDVYSFGMLLLEMVAGRKNTGGEEESVEEIHYPEWIYNLLEEGEDLRIQIDEEGDAKIAKRLAIVGLCCIQWHPAGRPTMKLAVQMLEGEGELMMPPNPFASTGTSSTTTKIPARHIAAFELEAIAE